MKDETNVKDAAILPLFSFLLALFPCDRNFPKNIKSYRSHCHLSAVSWYVSAEL